MKSSTFGFYSFMLLTFLLAILLSVFPLPYLFAAYRPEFVCLLCLYWALYTPERFSVLMAWCIGLFQDVVVGSVWGAHAIALATLTYICLLSYQRLRNYPLWQQALWGFVFLGIHQVVVSWVHGLEGYSYTLGLILLPAIVSLACWSPLVIAMQRLRHRYGMLQ